MKKTRKTIKVLKVELGKSLKRVVCGPFCRLRPICPIDDDIDWKWKASKMKQKEKNDKALKYLEKPIQVLPVVLAQ